MPTILIALHAWAAIVLISGATFAMASNAIGFASGPLKVHPVNSRYFADGTGKAILLTGSHHWSNLQDRHTTAESDTFDFERYLDILEKHNHNFIRLWIWEQFAWAPWTHEKVQFSPSAYQRTGPEKALDGLPKFDLSRFNQSFFDRLRLRVKSAGKRGIYVSVMLFQGFSIETRGKSKGGRLENSPWMGHPYNARNNVNGIEGDQDADNEGKEIHTLKIPAITRLQEAYVRKFVDTLNDLDNVLYEISNESHNASTDWQYHMIDYLHSYEESKAKRHPVLMTVQNPNGSNADLYESRAEAISPNSAGGYKNDPPRADGRKVIINDTDHLWGVGGDSAWVWKSFMRGLNPIYMDPLRSDVDFEVVRKNMGYAWSYADRIDLGKAEPRGDLASSGFCLANPGSEYAAFFPSDQEKWLDLSGANGIFEIEWLNPLSGKTHYAGTTKGGAIRTLESPFDGQAVLYVYRQPDHSSKLGN